MLSLQVLHGTRGLASRTGESGCGLWQFNHGGYTLNRHRPADVLTGSWFLVGWPPTSTGGPHEDDAYAVGGAGRWRE